MKTKTKVLLLTAIAMTAAGVTSYAQNAPDQTAPTPPAGAPHAPPPPFGQILQNILEKYDANKDGQLDATEYAALQQDIKDGKLQPPGPPPGGPMGGWPGRGRMPLPKELIEKYDVNHDGKLDETEREALHKDIQAGKVQLPPPGPGLPGPGQQPPTAAQLLEKFDADKDGKLDEAELTALLDDVRQHRLPPPRMRHGPGVPPADAPQPQQ